uniref:Brain expressed associated with NEDD4 1 n=1 Tax=Anser brachyrhynchus TaxID=132585 RepID=A0A8B9BYR2_9AVES
LSTKIPNPLSFYSTIYLLFSISNAVYQNLLVSPLLVAGVVIGLVLFLSCVTIIVGSLRKDGRLRHPHQRRDTVYDGFSYGGSFGELRSTCMEEFPPAFDFGSYLDTLSQVNIMYPDSPPRYDECVGPGATQMYIPTDDPPPYSLTDPCQGNEISINISLEEEEASGTTGQAANYAVSTTVLQPPPWGFHVCQKPQEGAATGTVLWGTRGSPAPGDKAVCAQAQAGREEPAIAQQRKLLPLSEMLPGISRSITNHHKHPYVPQKITKVRRL